MTVDEYIEMEMETIKKINFEDMLNALSHKNEDMTLRSKSIKMNFHVGDSVEILEDLANMKEGDIKIISKIQRDEHFAGGYKIKLEGISTWISPVYLKRLYTTSTSKDNENFFDSISEEL